MVINVIIYATTSDMKLIRFGDKGKEKPGIYLHGRRLDCSGHFKDWDRNFFVNNGLTSLRKIVDHQVHTLTLVPENKRWANPIARPGMIMCVGLNYSDHAKESGMKLPSEPVLFMKASNTISGPFDPVAIPKNSTKTDWEVELGIVLSKDALYLKTKDDAHNCIAGYAIVNDLSERTFQLEKEGQWVKGKSCPGFTPLGPYLVTRDELGDTRNLNMELHVNGLLRQHGNTSTMIFDPAYIVWYISQFMLLEAGDLISTGTPPGVGLGMDPPQYLRAGDTVELEIQGLGQQKQTFINNRS